MNCRLGIGGMHYALLRIIPKSWEIPEVQALDINMIANDLYEWNFGKRPKTTNLDQVGEETIARPLDPLVQPCKTVISLALAPWCTFN
jgi:hypothetical protein